MVIRSACPFPVLDLRCESTEELVGSAFRGGGPGWLSARSPWRLSRYEFLFQDGHDDPFFWQCSPSAVA
jgi:hypothetical protein